jgi:hypothetical protein
MRWECLRVEPLLPRLNSHVQPAEGPAEGTGTTTDRCTRNKDSALWFSKPSLQFAVAITFENLRRGTSLRSVGAK